MFSLAAELQKRNKRSDGYTSKQAAVIAEFQRDIELEARNALADGMISYSEYTYIYDAMRTALYRARCGDIPVTYESLFDCYLSALSIVKQ